MYLVGLTGGIGSGKSVAANRFAHNGVTVINADQIAREVVAPGSPALTQIAEKFGAAVLASDGSLDRKALREIIFNSETDRQWLEQLTHPLIQQRSRQRANAPRNSGEPPYRIMEVPLLFESGGHRNVDRTLLVDVDKTTQIQRVLDRDNCSQDQAESIIASQMSREKKRALADDIAENNGPLELLNARIDELHRLYCSFGNNKVQTND